MEPRWTVIVVDRETGEPHLNTIETGEDAFRLAWAQVEDLTNSERQAYLCPLKPKEG